MRKVLTFLLIFTGTVFAVFLFNLMLYACWPEYHDVLSASIAASTDDDIPVVTPVMVKEIPEQPQVTVEPEVGSTALFTGIETVEDEGVALTAQPQAQEPIIVDKQYHEDCGTGKGYWVITYSDGSTRIE